MLQHCCSHAHPVSILYCLLFSYNEYNYRPRKNAPQRASSRLRNRVPWYGVGCALILLPNDIAISDPARRHRGCDAIRLGFDRLRAPRRWMSGTSDAPPRQAIGVLERQSSNGRVHSRSQASSSDGGEGWILIWDGDHHRGSAMVSEMRTKPVRPPPHFPRPPASSAYPRPTHHKRCWAFLRNIQ